MNFSNASEYSNMSTNSSSPAFNQHHPSMFKVIVYIVLQVCSLVGNIILITVIFRTNALKSAFNHLVVNMAISDLFIPLLLIPYKIAAELRSTELEEWPIDGILGNLMCKMYWFITDMSPAVSSFSLVVIATNRFVAIVCPFSGVELVNKMTEKNKLFITLVWILAGLLYSPHFYFFELKDKSCEVKTENINSLRIYYGAIPTFTFFIPFAIITIEYAWMISKLYRKSESVKQCLNDKQYRSRQRRNKQIFVLSIAIIMSYAFLVGPVFCWALVYNFVFNWKYPTNEGNLIFLILHLMYMVYTSSNPIIYFAFVKSYRQGFKNLICGGKDPNAHQQSMSSNYRQSLIASSRV